MGSCDPLEPPCKSERCYVTQHAWHAAEQFGDATVAAGVGKSVVARFACPGPAVRRCRRGERALRDMASGKDMQDPDLH